MDRSKGDDQAKRLESYLSSPVIKRSVIISGHATSVSLEQPFWDILTRITKERSLSFNALISEIDDVQNGNLSSALRLYVLHHLTQ